MPTTVETTKVLEESAVPAGHVGAPPLYGRMMKAIASSHEWGNRVRMLKLPLIFAEERLYAGAIAQFYWLTATLEDALARHDGHPMVSRVKALGLTLTPGYAADLAQILGAGWRDEVARMKTAATASYCDILNAAGPVELVAASFILYGALVVGGGKVTQQKVKKVFPKCDHVLFDVADDMKSARQKFKNTYTAIGKEWPEHFETLEAQAARYMQLNNAVVLSVQCWGRRASTYTAYAAAGLAAAVTLVAAVRWARSG